MSYQILQYSCSKCGIILKKTEGDSYRDLFVTNTKEECTKRGSVLLKTLKKECKEWRQQLQNDKQNSGQSLLKFEITYHHYKQLRLILKEIE